MADYSTYLKAELVEFLNQRDATIKDFETQVQTLNGTIAKRDDTIGKKDAKITALENTNAQQTSTMSLQNQQILRHEVTINALNENIAELGSIIDAYERGTASTALQIINFINVLPDNEIKKLVQLTRTDSKGIEASVIFNYGKRKPLEKRSIDISEIDTSTSKK